MKKIIAVMFIFAASMVAITALSMLREADAQREEFLKTAMLAVDQKVWGVISVLETTPENLGKVRDLCALPEKRNASGGQPFWLECRLEAEFPSLPYRGEDALEVTYLLTKGHSDPGGIIVTVEAIDRNGKRVFLEAIRTRPLPIATTTQRRLAALSFLCNEQLRKSDFRNMR